MVVVEAGKIDEKLPSRWLAITFLGFNISKSIFSKINFYLAVTGVISTEINSYSDPLTPKYYEWNHPQRLMFENPALRQMFVGLVTKRHSNWHRLMEFFPAKSTSSDLWNDILCHNFELLCFMCRNKASWAPISKSNCYFARLCEEQAN